MAYRGPDPKFQSVTAIEALNGADVFALISNTTNAAGSQARVTAQVAGGTAGDAFYQAVITGVATWSWGIDNSDSDAWVLSAASALGTSNVIRATSSGVSVTGTLAASGAVSSNGKTLADRSAPVQSARVKSLGDADYTVLDTDGYDIIEASTTQTASRTVTLPTAADNTGRVITVVKANTGAYSLIIDGESSETIDGAASKTLFESGDRLSVYCNGTAWYTLALSLSPYKKQENDSFTFGGITVSDANKFVSIIRDGGDMVINAHITSFTPSGASCAIILPSGYTVDTTRLPSSATPQVGTWFRIDGSGTDINSTSAFFGPVFYDGSTSDRVFLTDQVSTTGFDKRNASSFLGGSGLTAEIRIPITQWAV